MKRFRGAAILPNRAARRLAAACLVAPATLLFAVASVLGAIVWLMAHAAERLIARFDALNDGPLVHGEPLGIGAADRSPGNAADFTGEVAR